MDTLLLSGIIEIIFLTLHITSDVECMDPYSELNHNIIFKNIMICLLILVCLAKYITITYAYKNELVITENLAVVEIFTYAEIIACMLTYSRDINNTCHEITVVTSILDTYCILIIIYYGCTTSLGLREYDQKFIERRINYGGCSTSLTI